MKKVSIIILITAFLAFLGYQSFKTTNYDVLSVNSPTQIVVDINQNGVIDDDETVSIENVEAFSTKLSDNQKELARQLKISDEDAIGLGYLAQNFAKETLLEKKVKLKNNVIRIDNKNYKTLLLNSGLAFVDSKPGNQKKFQENLKKVRVLNLKIFNNKSHKYHKLTCKYGLLAHNAQLLPQNQLPKDAKPCKFCMVKNNGNKKTALLKPTEDIIPNIPQAPTVFKSGNIKIFLTDLTRTLKPSKTCNTDVCRALINEVNSAQSTIDFAIYGYTKIPELQAVLEKAQKRGVKIRFVYDLDQKNGNIYPDTLYLAKIFKNSRADSDISGQKSKIMHDKFFIFDNKKVLTGSLNISSTDLSGFNSNATALINSPQIAEIYSKEFEQMYSGKFHKQKSKIKDKEHINIDNSANLSDFSIYFSPKDKAITQKVIPLIDGAQKYIYMPTFLITHKTLADSLVRASNRGVIVKVIIDATNAHGRGSKHKFLRNNGIEVKTENFAGKLHSKSIIIDDKYTIIGSMNFSQSGENINDENLVIIKNPEIAKFYKTFFQYLWKRIPDKYIKYDARGESLDSIGSCHDGIDNDFDGKIDMQDDSCKIRFKKIN